MNDEVKTLHRSSFPRLVLSRTVAFSLVTTCLLAAAVACVCASETPPATSERQRGIDAIEFIDRNFQLPDGFYADDPDRADHKPRRPAMIWPAGIALSALNAAAAIDPARVPAAQKYADALLAYRTTARDLRAYAPVPHGGERYFDDNEWLVLDFIQTAQLTRDANARLYLDRAEETMKFILSGESPDLGGGVWWRERRDTKNTCSNAPAICDALALYSMKPDDQQLAFAKRIYAWTNKNFQDVDGLFFDHLEHNGSLDKTKYSYNSALMIQANLWFFQITHDNNYLAEARRIAAAAEKHWFDRNDAIRDEACFAHMLCEAFVRLSQYDHDSQHIGRVQRALDFLAQHRSPDGFYPRYWNQSPPANEKPRLIDQASAARGFLVFAEYKKK